MHKQQATQTGPRRFSSRLPGTPGSGRQARRTGPRALPFAGGRGRPATSSGRFGGLRPGGRQLVRRGKQTGAKSPMTFARGVGARGKNKASKPRKGARRGPALLGVLACLGAAGAAAFKRRQNARSEPQAGPSAPDTATVSDTPPLESA